MDKINLPYCETCSIENCKFLKTGMSLRIGTLPKIDNQGRCEWMGDSDWEAEQQARKVVPLHREV